MELSEAHNVVGSLKNSPTLPLPTKRESWGMSPSSKGAGKPVLQDSTGSISKQNKHMHWTEGAFKEKNNLWSSKCLFKKKKKSIFFFLISMNKNVDLVYRETCARPHAGSYFFLNAHFSRSCLWLIKYPCQVRVVIDFYINYKQSCKLDTFFQVGTANKWLFKHDDLDLQIKTLYGWPNTQTPSSTSFCFMMLTELNPYGYFDVCHDFISFNGFQSFSFMCLCLQ